jgi:hypothetical protein
MAPTDARAGLQTLVTERDDLNQQNVPVSPWMFRRARKKIEKGDLLHDVDRATLAPAGQPPDGCSFR